MAQYQSDCFQENIVGSPVQTSRDDQEEEVDKSLVIIEPRNPTPMRKRDEVSPVVPTQKQGALKFVGFDEFEEKKKKSIADILMGTSKNGAGGNEPNRIISIYYPNADPRHSISQQKGGGIMRKSFKKGLKPRVNPGIKKKVRFTDEVTKGGEIATIYEVESFKTKESTKSLRGSGSGEGDENFHCKCSIF